MSTVGGALSWAAGITDAGSRLDTWVAAQEGGPSRSQVTRALVEGRLLLNGAVPAKAGVKLRAGDVVRLDRGDRAPSALVPEAIPLVIVYENDHLLVLDKPPGIVVHPGPGHATGTLVHALLHHLEGQGGLSGLGGADRPGIVHRLDRDTSGLLVVARDEATHRALAARFARHEIARCYLAVVLGTKIDAEGTIESLHARHPRSRLKFTGRGVHGRRAVTHWRVLARGEALSFVLCTLETGRTHQIRVHLAEAGYPVVADPLYGRAPAKGGGGHAAIELAAARRMPRQALHAAVLGFPHPTTGEPLRFVAPPPAELTTLIETAFGPEVLAEALAELRGGATKGD